MSDALEAGLARQGETTWSEATSHVVVDRGEMTIFVERAHLPAVARVLRDDETAAKLRAADDAAAMYALLTDNIRSDAA